MAFDIFIQMNLLSFHNDVSVMVSLFEDNTLLCLTVGRGLKLKILGKNSSSSIENRITFNVKKGYFWFLTPETMRLLRSTKIRQLKMKMVNTCLI